MRKVKRYIFDRDANGIKYKHPERSCRWCKFNPCLVGFDLLGVDFAKYGCNNFEEK